MGVKIRHVGKTYGRVRAVIDASLDIERGQMVVIQGANGSGKSTLLGIIGTLVRPTTGTVDYGDLGDLAAVRGKIGWLGHDTLCYPDLTGRENIELAGRLAGLDGPEAWQRAVERFALEPLAKRPVRTASRGQRQRVALARALVGAPALLLLDEPTTGLDVEGVNRLVTVLEAELSRGATVLVVTHDTPLVERLKGKRYQMDRGRLAVVAT